MTMEVGVEAEPGQSFDERLGEAVHQVLWRRKIRQTEFAKSVLGITQSAFSKKLRGDRPFFAVELSMIAAALGMPVAELMPEFELMPDGGGDDEGGAAGAPTRARTWDLRISSPSKGPFPSVGFDHTDRAAA